MRISDWSSDVCSSDLATYRVPGGGHNVMDNPIRLDDGTEWRFKDKYPLGLAPQFAGEVTDWSITTGWRTERDLGAGYSLTADPSARFGWDQIAYSMWDTVRSEERRVGKECDRTGKYRWLPYN